MFFGNIGGEKNSKGSKLTALDPFSVSGDWKQETGHSWDVQAINGAFVHVNDALVMFWGRIDNLDALCERLNTTGSHQSILAAWQKWGVDFPAHFTGEFAIAIIEPDQDRLILARDVFGVRPLFFFHDETQCMFSTTPAAILQAGDGPFVKNEKWISLYLVNAFLTANTSETAYRDIHRVPPAHTLVFERNIKTSEHSWHQWDAAPTPADHRDPRWVQEYHTKFQTSVRRRMKGKVIAAESSAGLDSSAIICTVAQDMGDTAKDKMLCFALSDAVLLKPLVDGLSEHLGGIPTIYHQADKDADQNEALTKDLMIMGYPAIHGSYTHPDQLSEARKNRGVETIFSGFGGDEVCSSRGALYFLECINRGEYRLAYDVSWGNPIQRVLRILKHKWLNGAVSEKVKHARSHQTLSTSVLNRAFITKHNLQRVIIEQNFGTKPYRSINAEIIEKEFQNNNIQTRFECHSLLASAYGLEFAWPFWDVDLVQQFLTTPSIEKLGPNGVQRYLHRQAMQGIVPDNINSIVGKHLGGQMTTAQDYRNTMPRLLAEFRETMDGLHPELERFVDRDKIDVILARTGSEPITKEEFVAVRAPIINLAKLNHWYHNGI